MFEFLLPAAIAVWIAMTLLFCLAMVLKNNSIVDVGWGLGFVLVAGLSAVRKPGFEPRHALITALVLVWGIRLAAHIFRRNRKRGEDFRYAAWRESWGRGFVLRSYFQIFMLQGLFLVLISAPLPWINGASGRPLGPWDVAGGLLWLMGFLFEAVGDAQLARFKKDPANKGKLIRTGLWNYSRHPNYFGEALMWWGIYMIALAVPGGGILVFSPLTITLLLRFVSGVPLLEKRYRDRAEFQEYARRTNAFIPWFPRHPPAAKTN
jgi:steroid 5-alpha reductase family enzyme